MKWNIVPEVYFVDNTNVLLTYVGFWMQSIVMKYFYFNILVYLLEVKNLPQIWPNFLFHINIIWKMTKALYMQTIF